MSLSVDERNLLEQVSQITRRATQPNHALVAAIRTKVNYCRRAFPEEFVNVLYSDDREYQLPGDRVQALNAILLADEDVPSSLKDARRTDLAVVEQLDPTFSLADEEKARVLLICGELRKSILSSQIFDIPHRRRLLDRVAAIEREVHLPKGRLDVILGGVSDIGETAGKFGRDIKPLFDRMKEIAGIARKGSSEYDQLPAPEEVKQLPPPSDE